MRETSVAAALGRKYPEWIVFVTSRDGQGRANVMPVGWSMFASEHPLLLAIALNQRSTTHANIQATGEFVVAFPAPGMEEAVDYTGSRDGWVPVIYIKTQRHRGPSRGHRPPRKAAQ